MLIAFASFAQTEKYSRVRIYTDGEGIRRLAAEGIAVDHGYHRPGVFLETDLSQRELSIVRSKGYRAEVIIENVSEHYTKQIKTQTRSLPGCTAGTAPNIITPQGFALGSMGGFFTHQEMLDQLDTLASRYPSLVSIKAPISSVTTVEGRNLHYIKISDNPSVDEPEPEVLYTALHHSREPAGMQQLIFYMYYLLENYQTDQEIAYLLNNTELYFVPCVNPDGYVYNEITNPNGGGMWRKNRKNNGDGTRGIDINRNYGYFWGHDNSGSSPTTSSETYRGTAPFSEPETQAMKEFAEAREFKVAINYHTYGNLLIYPWGYEPIYTSDSAAFSEFAIDLTLDNNYRYGTAVQTVNYPVNGSSDDWMYGDTTNKSKIFSMTPEAGHTDDGFWPPSSNIEDICKVNITQNLKAAKITGKYATVKDIEGQFLASGNGYLSYEFKRLGLDPTGTYSVSIVPVGSAFASVGSPKIYSGLQLLQMVTDSISYSLSSVSQGTEVVYLLAVNNGGYTHSDTIRKIFGQPVLAFSNPGSLSGLSTSTWGTSSTVYYTPSSSVTDSPFGDYNNNEVSTVTMASEVSLTNTSAAYLSYNAKWALETGWDYVQIQASTDNGLNWTALCGKFTKTGNANQAQGEPLYDGFQNSWVQERIDLSDYLGQNIKIRFLLVSDSWQAYDGFYFDELKIEKLPDPSSISNTPNLTVDIYPNPSAGLFTVARSNNEELDARIFDNYGRLVLSAKLGSNDLLDLSNLASGNYIAELKNNSGKVTRKKLVLLNDQ